MSFAILNPAGERIDYSLAEGDAEKRRQDLLVVLGHGVTGNKDRPILVETARALNAAGFDTLRFSFAGNGDSEGDFREATITKEMQDLDAVLNAVSEVYPEIAYIGHSMGGAAGVLKASLDGRIRYLVSLAGMVDTKAFAETEFGDVTPDEGVMWDDEDCPLSSAFMQDLCETVGTVAPQAEGIRVPWLLVHGTADDVVLPKDSQGLKARLGDRVDLVMIEGADHVFSGEAHMEEATRTVAEWLAGKVAANP